MIGPARFLRNVASPNRERRLFALKMIADKLIPDFRLTWHQIDWWRDPDFNAYLDHFNERGGFNTHRKWTLWQLLRLTAQVDGETAECGVYLGASSWLICAGTQDRTGNHHLFDSFEGLSTPSVEDGTYWKRGALAVPEDTVRKNLAQFEDRLVFHKGWIPEHFPKVSNKKFRFVHIDVDLFHPTFDSVEFFYSRLSPGGILLCDDYGFSSCPGATAAVNKFLADKPEKMIMLDAGGGFLIKGTEVITYNSISK